MNKIYILRTTQDILNNNLEKNVKIPKKTRCRKNKNSKCKGCGYILSHSKRSS